MKLAITILLATLLYGCCSTETVTREQAVPYMPKQIADSVATLVQIRADSSCDAAVQEILTTLGNYAEEGITKEGDKWKTTVRTLVDSMWTLKDENKRLRLLHRTTSIDVQPHKDSTIVLFTVREVKPFSFYDNIRLAAFIPLLILVIGEALLLFLFVKAKT